MVWSLRPTWLPRSEPAGAAIKILPSAVLRGHTSNVRPLHWNSEVPWLLLSGSWDGTVRAWDVRKAGVGLHSNNAPKGEGHTSGNMRAAAGSTGAECEACIAVMSDHVADVYGLSASPSRPFCYASVSRDTTLRVFNLEGVVSSTKARAMIDISLSSSLADVGDSMLLDAPAALCGTTSRLLEAHLRGLQCSEGTSSVAAFRKLFDFFWGSDGIETFWEMVRWVDAAAAARASNPATGDDDGTTPCRVQGSLRREQQQSRLSFTSGSTRVAPGAGDDPTCFLRGVPKGLMCVEERVVHRDARRASGGALARRLSTSPTFIVQDRRLGKADRLERAFRLHLAAGDLRSSCEVLIALGRWETALSLAPGVGMEYWRAVADRYVEVLSGEAQARDYCEQSTGGSGGQIGSDATALATALLSSTGRPLDAIRHVLTGSEEALSLAAAVADGAYPPRAPLEPLSQEASNQSAGGVHAVSEEKEAGRRRMGEEERSTAERAAVKGRTEDGGCGGAKLLALIDDHMEEGATEGRGRTIVQGTAGTLSPIEAPEKKRGATSTSPPPLHIRRPYLHQRAVPAEPRAAAAAAAVAAQRGHGEALLCSITESKAEAFFQASQPALAAAAMLSICDGSRATAAPALAFLIRGDEPELAYAAATALKFPAREVAPLVREMARRAEAWGDYNLSVDLILNAVGQDEISSSFDTEREIGVKYMDGNSVPRGDHHPVAAADSGYWPAEVYGACGEEAGPRGAAMIVTRATTSSWMGVNNTSQNRASPCPSLTLRSIASYLEDATAAIHRGMDVEAVRLLVLGGDLEQACERGVSFLRKNVPVLSFPAPPPNKSAFSVVRALGSGSDGGLPLNQVSPRLRMEVLAYASFVGAVEAIARGYNPVVAPLLRTASICVEARERMVSGAIRERMLTTDADEKDSNRGSAPRGGDHSRSPSPGRQRSSPRARGRAAVAGERRGNARPSGKSKHSLPAKSSVFPACMSAAALALATVQHLTMWSKERGDARTFSSSSTKTGACAAAAGCSPQHALEEQLSYQRWVRDEEKILSDKDDKALDDLLPSTFRTADKTSPRSSIGSTVKLTAEAKSCRKINGNNDTIIGSDDGKTASVERLSSDEKGDATSTIPAAGRRRTTRRRGNCVSSGNDQPGSYTAGDCSSSSPFSPWRNARGEIVVSGSRLPSCRRHQRVPWRTAPPRDAASDPKLQSNSQTRVARPIMATSSLDEFGREAWPRPRGAAFMLEDNETVLGLNEAVMWSKVNPFSPLNTGCRITPF